MITNLLIAASFLTVIILQLIPYRTTVGDITIFYSYGILPGLFTFLIICTFLLLATILLTQYKFKQALQGQIVIKRKNMNVKRHLAGIAYWVAFVVTSQLLAENYLYFLKGTASYFFIILGTVITYQLLTKWFVQKNKPDFLSISNDNVYFMSLWGNGKRKMDNLKSVGYNTNQNAITLNFKEGLDNIQLHLTDYEITDILNFIRNIKQTSSNTVHFEESFNKHFSATS